jgi:hypothetical protein
MNQYVQSPPCIPLRFDSVQVFDGLHIGMATFVVGDAKINVSMVLFVGSLLAKTGV